MNDDFYHEVKNMRIRCRDYIDKRDDRLARELDDLLADLENEARTDMNTYSVKESLKRIIVALKTAADQAVMSRGDADTMSDWAEDTLKKF